jgi:hypothetical protein
MKAQVQALLKRFRSISRNCSVVVEIGMMADTS